MMSTVDDMMIGLRLDDALDPSRILEMLRTGIMAVIDSLAAKPEAA